MLHYIKVVYIYETQFDVHSVTSNFGSLLHRELSSNCNTLLVDIHAAGYQNHGSLTSSPPIA